MSRMFVKFRCRHLPLLLLSVLQFTFLSIRVRGWLPSHLSYTRQIATDNRRRDIKRFADSTSNGSDDESKEKALSALSQPRSKISSVRKGSKGLWRKSSSLPKAKSSNLKGSNAQPTSRGNSGKKSNTTKASKSTSKASFASLLPPPLTDSLLGDDESDSSDNSLSSGLSSWEEFLGVGTPSFKRSYKPYTPPSTIIDSSVSSSNEASLQLPSMQDLFPPDLSRSSSIPTRSSSSSALDGVLPVADLFFRSTSVDDEELPFSAEQSDAVSSDHNKVHIRRNMAETIVPSKVIQKPNISSTKKNRNVNSGSNNNNNGNYVDSNAGNNDNGNSNNRKMVRRRMEMIVGGVPINADPPQRAVELFYDSSATDWASVITMNTRDLGPLWHLGSVGRVSPVERGLFCEYFGLATLKWDVCPGDFRTIIQEFCQEENLTANKMSIPTIQASITADGNDESSLTGEESNLDGQTAEVESPLDAIIQVREEENEADLDGFDDDDNIKKLATTRPKAKGFASKVSKKKTGTARYIISGGVLHFVINVSEEELASGETEKGQFTIFKSIVARGVSIALKDELDGFTVKIVHFELKDMGDGSCNIFAELGIESENHMKYDEIQQKAKRLVTVFTQLTDDGNIGLFLAAAAREETRWSDELRDRVVEECLFEDDEEDLITNEDEDTSVNEDERDEKTDIRGFKIDDLADIESEETNEWPNFWNLEDLEQARSTLNLGGNGGVHFDYSAKNAHKAPFQGQLGLRLIDAVIERAKQQQPRVIAIGDAHGCIDEVQDLLRQCDYRPGDLVLFLGDLVCKGPDSLAVRIMHTVCSEVIVDTDCLNLLSFFKGGANGERNWCVWGKR
jgi:hypothetical protein